MARYRMVTFAAGALIAAVLATAGLAINRLSEYAHTAAEQLVVTTEIESRVNAQSAIEWKAVSEGRLSRKDLGRAEGLREEVEAHLRQLQALDPDDRVEREEIPGSVRAYERHYFTLLGHLRRGDLEAAEEVDEELVDPNFERVTEILEASEESNEAEALAAGRLESRLTAGTLGAATLVVVALLALGARSQRRLVSVRVQDRARERGRRRLDVLLRGASDLLFVVAEDGTLRSVFGNTQKVLARPADELIDRPLVELLHPEDVPHLASLVDGVAGRPGAETTVQWRLARADGRSAHVETVARNLVDDPDVGGLVLTSRDISDRKAFEDQLRHRAFHDPLTSLPNRALFGERVGHALGRSGRTDARVGVLFVDLDDFKLINDRLGHAAGDELLVGVAKRLRACLRSADTAARLGGDEFAVLLEAIENEAQAVEIADRILQVLRDPFSIHGDPVVVRPSIGIALGTADEVPGEELLRRADFAMYAAKNNGKGRYEIFDRRLEAGLLDRFGHRMDGEEPDRVTWFMRSEEHRREIVDLLEDPEGIVPVYQPILDLRTGLVAGYEALARFPGRDPRPPNAWFSEAHRQGLGVELELKAVAAALARRPPGDTYVAVNLSPPAVVSRRTFDALPADLTGVVVEVTENELVAEGQRLEDALARLRERGARLAVDDTGAGYAGLKQLTRLRPDIIKLDRALVHGVHADAARAALIESLVRYGTRMGAAVCAEGIEELADLRTLADLDVAYGQGWAIARPVPPWAAASPDAVEACRAALRSALTDTQGTSADALLASLSHELFTARERDENFDAAMAIAAEVLDAAEVYFSLYEPEADLVRTAARHGDSPLG